MQEKLIARAKELLAEGKVQKVVGWRKGLFDYDVTPSVFTSASNSLARAINFSCILSPPAFYFHQVQ